jgi:hypothetical protein
MKIAISQPRYLPALVYLNRLARCDKFVLLDTVQRQSRGWENRNKLLCGDHPKWLTIPIASSSRSLIYDAKVSNFEWVEQHKATIKDYYSNAPYFEPSYVDQYFKGVIPTLEEKRFSFTEVIIKTLLNLSDILDLGVNLVKASELDKDRNNWTKGPSELLRIAKKINADHYISGPNGKEYGVKEIFEGENIMVGFHYFSHPEYDQNLEKFIPNLGFFDSLFFAGLESTRKWIKNDLKLFD